MKCPNCGNEAINVNGKYVCLDCGVEISPNTNTDDLAASLEPKIDNHFAPEEPPKTEPETPAVSFDVPEKIETPVKNQFMDEIKKEETPSSGGVYDFGQATDTSKEEAPAPAPIPDFPGQAEAPVEETPKEEEQQVPEVPSEPVESVAPEMPQPEVDLPQTEPEPVGTPESIPTETKPEDFFQPSKVDIAPQKEEVPETVPTPEVPVTPEPLPPVEAQAESTPVEIPTVEAQPVVPPAPPIVDTPVTVPVTPVNEVPEEPVVPAPIQPTTNPGENLDDLLDKYNSGGETTPVPMGAPSSFDSLRPAQTPQAVMDKAPEAPVEQTMPGISDMPTPASVFGAEGLDDPTAVMESKEKKNKKLKIIIGAVAGVVVLLLILFGVVASQQSAIRNKQQQRAELVQGLMESVPKKMDEPIDVKVSFKDSLDFSNVKLKSKIDPDLGKNLLTMFANPITNEGTWDTNNGGDLAQNNKLGTTTYEHVYIDSEKMTYFKENGVWGKKDGREIVKIPGFYNAVERGSLFYSAKVKEMKFVGLEENEDGEQITTLKVIPNDDFVKEIIGAVTPAMAKVNYQRIDVSALNIEVTVNEANEIQTVVAKGDIDIDCDYFEGKIAVDSEGTYKYSASEIEKPELSQKKPLIILTNTVIQSDFVAPKKEDTKGRG